MPYSAARAVAALMFSALTLGAADPPPLNLPPPGMLPAEPAAELAALIGEYGATDSLLTVYEDRGRLLADGLGLQRAALRRVAQGHYRVDTPIDSPTPSTLVFELDGGRPAVAVELNGARLPRRDIGAEVIATIKAGERSDAAALRAEARSAKPPVEPAPARSADLVDLASVDPSLKFDIRYATTNNFMGFALYERPEAFLQRPAALALARAAQELRALGYGLLIHDAYRPWFVTKMFWDATPATAHMFVADPSEGSRHNRGCAVDLTLYDLATGDPVEMTGRYDEMSHRSFADYVGGTSRERWLRDLLRRAMERQGFTVYPQEWWHFDYKDWDRYAIGNASFEELERPTASR